MITLQLLSLYLINQKQEWDKFSMLSTIDLQNVTVGDILKRAWSFFVNEPPALQKLLTAD